MPRIRRRLAQALVALVAAAALVPITAPAASAVTTCNNWSWIISFGNSRYTSAELGSGGDHGMLRARATSVGNWEKFTIARWGPNPAMYTIRSQANGRYVSAELGYGGGRYAMLRARATSIGNWEKFLILCGTPAQCWF